jgi:hypothetical protein
MSAKSLVIDYAIERNGATITLIMFTIAAVTLNRPPAVAHGCPG